MRHPDVAPQRLLPASAGEADEVVGLHRRTYRYRRLDFFFRGLCNGAKLGKRFVNTFDETRHIADRNIIVTHMGRDDIGSQFEQAAILFHFFLLV